MARLIGWVGGWLYKVWFESSPEVQHSGVEHGEGRGIGSEAGNLGGGARMEWDMRKGETLDEYNKTEGVMEREERIYCIHCR